MGFFIIICAGVNHIWKTKALNNVTEINFGYFTAIQP